MGLYLSYKKIYLVENRTVIEVELIFIEKNVEERIGLQILYIENTRLFRDFFLTKVFYVFRFQLYRH